MCIRDSNRVITMMYRVFNRLPAIPVVCFLALVTVVKNAQLTARMPFTTVLSLIHIYIIKAGTTSPYSLYNENLASFTTGDLYDHHDAEGLSLIHILF